MDKLTAELMRKMIAFSEGNLHDINHFLKVYAYARTIAVGEGVPDDIRTTVEIAAIVHDIACPLCRVKYGNTNGKKQEEEGIGLTRAFLSDSGLPEAMRERIVYLVGHHHTPAGVDGPDYQILLEADYLVNANEMNASPENIRTMKRTLFRTATGRALLEACYAAARDA